MKVKSLRLYVTPFRLVDINLSEEPSGFLVFNTMKIKVEYAFETSVPGYQTSRIHVL
jgi:hypothetical protein